MSARQNLGSLGAAALLCVFFGIHADGKGGGALPLGQSLAGETCETSGAISLTRAVDIICGPKSVVVGSVRASALGAALPADASARREAIFRAALAARAGDEGQVTCDGGQWLNPPNPAGSGLLVCTLQSNGWPRVILVAASETALYEAEGMPSTFPVLQSAIGFAANRAVSQSERDAGLKALQAKVPPDVLKAASSDASGYDQFVQLGRLYGGANNFAGAENAYRQALEIETRLFGSQSIPVGETLAELGLQVSNQGRFDEAQALFQRATPIVEGAATPALRARLASYRALDAANRRAFDEALTYARQATAARRAEVEAATRDAGPDGPPVSHEELAHSLRIEAEMALRLGDLAGARASAEEALWIMTEEPGLPLWWRPGVLTLMGQINERDGRTVAAERDYRDAVELDKKLFGPAAPTALAELKLGRFYADQQVYGPALATFREGFAILQKDPIARTQIVPDQIVPYMTAATAQDPAHELDTEVFNSSQYIASGVADQTIARMAAREAADTPALADLVRQSDEAQRARDKLRMNLAAEHAKADDERSAARERQMTADLQLASTRSDQLVAQVNQAYPDYARLASPGPAALSDVQTKLGPNEAFLSYVIGVNGSFGLLVTQRGLTVRPLAAKADDLAADITDLRKAFVPAVGRVPEFSTKSSYALYKVLLAPFEAQLAGVNHLVVATSGDLASLPFALLVTAEPRSKSYTDAAWLVRRMALSQVPSARAFLLLHDAEQKHAAPSQPFFGVGAPAFGGGGKLDALATACLDNGPVSADVLRALPPLPETAGEVNAIGRKLGAGPGTILTGAAASERDVRAAPLDRFAVLYFATHGLLPGELHCQAEPGLALSPAPGATSTNADGLLTAGDIASLKINADLVVLSACNTAAGGGGRFGGGALEGLADAFFDAGARAVIASHWQVPSGATVQLMTGMFDRLGANRGAGLAEALRQSQIALLSQPRTSHPFNWAAFTLIGDGNTVLNTVSLPPKRLAEAGNP
jgi:CHAT domain-containing protein/tetratricopeptide (TPR) repeat protein